MNNHYYALNSDIKKPQRRDRKKLHSVTMNILKHSRGNIAANSTPYAVYPTRLKRICRYEKQTNSYTDRYVNLSYNNQGGMQHVSATYCGHL